MTIKRLLPFIALLAARLASGREHCPFRRRAGDEDQQLQSRRRERCPALAQERRRDHGSAHARRPHPRRRDRSRGDRRRGEESGRERRRHLPDPLVALRRSAPPIFKSKFDSIIVEAAKKFDVDAALVSAVIKAESDFNAREVSDKGARGLMQLMPSTAERFGVTDSYDPGREHLRRRALPALAAQDVQRQRRPRRRRLQRRRRKRLEVQRRAALPRDDQLHQPHREAHPQRHARGAGAASKVADAHAR